jgi:hypothetical protein
MRERLAKLGSWARRALILGALIGAPVLVAAPAAEAQTVHAVLAIGAPEAQLVPVQWGPPPRPYYGPRHRHWHRPPPPPHWRRHHAHRRHYGPPPRYYRHARPHYYR